ncbi:unnamed protein product [Menidia menidia]|uniref:(Atlantic silverside) hypothetical protein n=1 Tax=Menidia menidia TaxID=238744 RepID=A0A8S4ACE8_9TELE|nr:unnamed protein product [Menidia menidia]
MPNITRNSAKPAFGAGANEACETASANQASQKAAPSRNDIEETEAAAARHIPGEVAKELAKLSALIVEKSVGQDKKLEEIRISTKATESKIADIADRIGEVENRLCFLEDEHERRKANPAATADEDSLRAVRIRMLFQDRNRIAEAARKLGDVSWEEHRVMVFADYSKLLSDKRAKFNKCKKLLHNKHMRFSPGLPCGTHRENPSRTPPL